MQVIETISTNTEAWWTEFIFPKGRVTRSNTTTTGTNDMCFIVKRNVNDINEVVRGFLIAAEGKERDNATEKIINVLEVVADQASKNKIIMTRLLDHQGKLTAKV